MKNLIDACLLLAVVCWSAGPLAADETPAAEARSPNLFFFGLGPSFWSGVNDIDPSGSPFADQLGRFHTWGVAFDIVYQRRVARLGRFDLTVGGDFGVFSHENSVELDVTILPFGETVDGTLSANGLYLTPSVRLLHAGADRWRFSFGGGAGYYRVEFAEFLEPGFEVDDVFSESELAGYLALGLDRRLRGERSRWHLRFEHKVHFADFGPTDSYAPGGGDLTGPVNTLLIGVAYDP